MVERNRQLEVFVQIMLRSVAPQPDMLSFSLFGNLAMHWLEW